MEEEEVGGGVDGGGIEELDGLSLVGLVVEPVTQERRVVSGQTRVRWHEFAFFDAQEGPVSPIRKSRRGSEGRRESAL